MKKCSTKQKVQSGMNQKQVARGKKIIFHGIGSAYRNLRGVKKKMSAVLPILVTSVAATNITIPNNGTTILTKTVFHTSPINYLPYIGVAVVFIAVCVIAYALGRRNAPR